MKKHHLIVIILIASLSFSNSAKARGLNEITSLTLSSVFHVGSLHKIYEGLSLSDYGISKEAVDYALQGYENLLYQGKVNNVQYISIVDFSQPLGSKRFYLLDVLNHELVMNTYVMHGVNSGKEMAERFSNTVNSFQSSLGFYLTKYTYTGKRGYSLRIAGLEEGYNTNAEKRGVVVHGSNYINEQRATTGKVERSQGCPALPKEDHKKAINLMKDGSVMFLYHPSEEYLQNSQVLNN